MKEQEIEIQQLDSRNFEFQDYISSDENLIAISDLDTIFDEQTDYVEYCIYDESNNKIYPDTSLKLLSYKVLKGDVILDPISDLSNLGYDDSTYSILYNFYKERLSSSITSNYYIKEISSDRTEIRLDSNDISNLDIISLTQEFIQYRNNAEYFVDFLLNFGNNKTIIANNIKLEDEETDDPTIIIKLYEPLPQEFNLKSTLWVVEEISTPQMYKVIFPFIPLQEVNTNFIGGPNFNLKIKDESGVSGQLNSFNSLINTDLTSSANQLKSLLDRQEIEINIDYENYSDFVNFSSAKTRLENFSYKVGLIENYTNAISASLGKISSPTSKSLVYSASKASYESQINNIINNFDGYDYFLYYNSGSKYSWPKKTSTSPYELYSTGSTEALEWLGSIDPSSIHYGGQALSASNYDQNNQDYLYWAIPEYLRDDKNNDQYLLFVDMVAQQYDNTWLYTKDLTNKFNADNRLEYGISKDLVAEAIKDFGVKLYSNNFNTNDLYTAFLGLTPSGSVFPFPEITDTFPSPTGYEYVDTRISSSNDPIALDGMNKRLYKRIYHNLPYLFKAKGTVAGLRALITTYGIPDTILRINEFGGKDRNNSQDWDLQQKVFNYAFDTEGKYIISSSFTSNDDFGGTSPETVQLRFKTNGIPTDLSQSIYYLPNNRSALVLEYTGSGLISGSHLGSVPNPYNKYGTLKFIPDFNTSNISASLFFPFFDGEWWSVQTTVNSNNTASLQAANQINKNLGFSGSSTVSGFNSIYYFGADKIVFPSLPSSDVNVGGKKYKVFSGSYQEIRYYNTEISSNVFYDYTMNPYSFEGDSINSTPEELIFRADLGTLLNTGSTTSVHPKITGSSVFTTQSFASNSEFYISSSNFIVNREYIHQDQVISGIKNRVTDKININDPVLPSGNTLSPMISIQQESFESSSYTPDINYLEVAFSPQDQINDDINAQMGYFNIGEYIGDPRHISEPGRNYPDLDTLRDAYFNKYINSYNLVDFVRLMKFFDNSLFKMIKDFTPARTSLSSGVVVKQHILERNRQRPPQVSYENITYSGSVKPQSRNYNTGSSDVGQYEHSNGSSIYKFSGGTGGSLEKFNGLEFSPSASAYNLTNRFGITQSYDEFKEGKLGREVQIIFNQDEFYNGEFSGSNVNVVTQSLSPGCIKYHDNPDIPLQYFPLFFSDSATDSLYGTTTLEGWNDQRNEPQQGYAWIFTTFNPQTQLNSVSKIKLAARDKNGNDIRDSLLGTEFVQFLFPEGFKKYFVEGTVINTNSATLTIENDRGDYLFASSSNGGSENWSLRAYGNISGSNNLTIPGYNPNSQNIFHAESSFQIQPIRYYNGGIGDILGFFNTGSDDFTSTPLLSNEEGYSYGTYTIPRTPNIPWVLSASIAYSASGGGEISVPIISQGTYHYGNHFEAGNRFDGNVSYLLDTPGETASFYQPSQASINLDSSFFNLNVNDTALGDELHPFRISYLFTTDLSPSNNTYKKVGFNNSNISLATEMFISLYDNESGTWIDSVDMQKFNQASSWNIYDPTTDNNRITVAGATTKYNGSSPIFANSGNIWMVKQFNAGNAVSFGNPFSNNDGIKVIPNTISDSSGHPRILQAGTASFDFNFDEFSIGGTPAPVRPPKLTTLPLQGPQGSAGNVNNNNITFNDYGNNYNFVSFPSGSTDGVFSLNLGDLKYFLDGEDWDNSTDPVLRVNYRMRVISGIPFPNNPFDLLAIPNSVSTVLQLQKKTASPLTSFNPLFGTNRTYLYPAPRTATAINQQVILNKDDINAAMGPRRNDEYNLRLAFQGLNTVVGYDLEYIEITLQCSSTITTTTTGTGGNTGIADVNGNIQTTTTGNQIFQFPLGTVSQDLPSPSINNLITFPGPTSTNLLNGTVRQFLWITGSEHHPRQLITASNELYSQILTGSSTLYFPDSPISNIERTSSYNIERFAITESSGASVTFEYTDPHKDKLITSTLTSASKGIFGIREGELQPTQIGGSGTIVSQSLGIETVYPTYNTTGSMYFIEQRIESASVTTPFQDDPLLPQIHLFTPGNNSTYPQLYITNSITSGEEGYRFTGSLQIYKGSADNISTLGTPIFSRNFIVPNSMSARGAEYDPATGPPDNDWSILPVQVSGSFINNFQYNDTFRLVISADKSISSKLDVTEYTMSLFPSESKFGSITEDFSYYGKIPGSASYASSSYGGEITILTPGYGKYSKPKLTDTIVPSFYGSGILPFALALDCQPLINNYNSQRKSNYLMDVDYTNTLGSIIPVNFQQILTGSAVKATVPDSNYTQESWIAMRYDGSKAQSSYINEWTPTDFGTFGQLPVLELRNAYFSYFSSIQDPYPIYNDSTRLNLSYLIDSQGNALPPSLQGVAKDVIDKTFPIATNSKISLDITSDSQELQELNEENVVKVIGKYPVPVMYSQTSSRGYSNSIPITGSGRVSLYDNPGSGFTEFSFTAEGTASLSSGRSVKGTLDPTLFVEEKDFGGGLIASQSYSDGVISFANEKFDPEGNPTPTDSDELSQLQYISLQTALPTTYIYSGDWKKKGNFFKKSKSAEYIEFTLKLGLKYTDENNEVSYLPFVPEDVRLRVWKGTIPYDAGSVVDKIAFEQATPSRVQTRGGSFWRKSRSKSVYQSTSGLKLDRENKLHAKINEDAVYAILNAKGLGGGGIEEGGSIEGLEWIITANSGENVFTKGSSVEWEIDSSILAGNNSKNAILPSSFTGPKAATKISMVGSKTHLLENDNTASAPYWIFTGSGDQRFLEMSSTLLNEAYGDKFSQGELPYNPGPYEGFPGNQEPEGTKIGTPFSTLSLQKGDEIRFGNNENYVYKIITVYSPQENIDTNGIGRIKVKLDKPVPKVVNKDFFLIRRYIDSANSLILDMEYPYKLFTTSASFVEGNESNGKLLTTPDNLLNSVKAYPAAVGITGSYINVPLIYSGSNVNSSLIGIGKGAEATVVISGSMDTQDPDNYIHFIQVTNPGEGYSAGDILQFDNEDIIPDGVSMVIEVNPLNLGKEKVFTQNNDLQPLSSPGILFPSYPTTQVENSASILINDLISKGVINN